MAIGNSSLGQCRTQGELKAVGHTVASTTVANVLEENGIKPAPDRPSCWRWFLKAHWGQIAATEFFLVEVWTPKDLTAFYILFVIDLKSRVMTIAGITRNPNEFYMAQMARVLTDCVDCFLREHRFLTCDRDTKFTKQFKDTPKSAGVETVLTPYQAPNCNAFAERFVLSIKSECLDWMIFFGEDSLRRACPSYLKHYHVERPHQSLGNERIEAREPGECEVQGTERLGGILKHESRAA